MTQDHRAGAQLRLAEPDRDPIGLIEQQHRELAFVIDVFVERLLMADRHRIVLGDHRPGVLAASERREVMPVFAPSLPTSAASG